jgi:hypothetical protein
MYQTKGRIYIDNLASYVTYDTTYDMSKTPFVFNKNGTIKNDDGEARYNMSGNGKVKIIASQEDDGVKIYIDEDGDGVYSLNGDSNYQYDVCDLSCQIGTYDEQRPGENRRWYNSDCSSSQVRTCQENGEYDGNPNYNKLECDSGSTTTTSTSTSTSTPTPTPTSISTSSSCTLDGKTINESQSHVFYSVKYSTNCSNVSKQERTCHNGEFDGDASYKYSDCLLAPIINPSDLICEEQTDEHKKLVQSWYKEKGRCPDQSV